MFSTGTILFSGLLLGIAYVRLAVVDAPDPSRRVGHTLLVAAVIYVAFAMGAMEREWLLIELGGVALFGVFVLLGFRHSPKWLAAGWALHVLWDVPLHTATDVAFVPGWYPLLCVGFDLVIAAYAWRSLPASVHVGALRGAGS